MGIFLPALLIIGFFYFIFRQAQGTNNQAISFGKSRARMFTGDHPTIGFEDVAGCDAVSYTHLDVYKRQQPSRASA